MISTFSCLALLLLSAFLCGGRTVSFVFFFLYLILYLLLTRIHTHTHTHINKKREVHGASNSSLLLFFFFAGIFSFLILAFSFLVRWWPTTCLTNAWAVFFFSFLSSHAASQNSNSTLLALKSTTLSQSFCFLPTQLRL